MIFVATNAFAESTPETGFDPMPDDAWLEEHDVRIAAVILEKRDIFDTDTPDENKSLFRLANRLHIDTRNRTVTAQLLFVTGDLYSRRLLNESERMLRRNRYLYDAHIYPINYRNGYVDIVVSTRDVWTLNAGFSATRSGGANSTNLELEELNLLGLGSKISIDVLSNVDRDSTVFEYSDLHLRGSWTQLSLIVTDSSDGDKTSLLIDRPFYALDSRWALGGEFTQEDRIDNFYDSGNPESSFRHQQSYGRIYAGTSRGISDGWVARWTAGVIFDDHRFSTSVASVPSGPLPVNRKLVYPFVGYELIEDDYRATHNQDQIDRTEDVYLGTHFSAEVGMSTGLLGADQAAFVYKLRSGMGFGSPEATMLLIDGGLTGWLNNGSAVNTRLGLNARYYRRQSDKRLLYAGASVLATANPVLDDLIDIGGDIGLRGYPLRYQTGDGRALLTIEQRFYSDWYPFRLFRVGGAVFADAGRIWGNNPVGNDAQGWLTDVGFGLRLGSTRSGSGKMLHLDVAFPLNGDSSIDGMQIILETKKSF